jgi:hypothetical protein
VATNLELNPKLVDEAKTMGNFRTKREAVTAALEEFVSKRKQREVIKLFGKVDYAPDYDYKKSRRK